MPVQPLGTCARAHMLSFLRRVSPHGLHVTASCQAWAFSSNNPPGSFFVPVFSGVLQGEKGPPYFSIGAPTRLPHSVHDPS